MRIFFLGTKNIINDKLNNKCIIKEIKFNELKS
jgi:hypothetical protein